MNNLKNENPIIKLIKEAITAIGPRPPCSDNERKFAKFINIKLKNFCDETEIESFKASPSSYRASFRLPMILYIISLFFYNLIPILSLVFISISILILIAQMTLAYGILDPFFKKNKSKNVIGKIKPKTETKRIIILCSHLDSNWEFPLIKKWGVGFGVIIFLNYFFSFIFLIVLFIKVVLGVEFLGVLSVIFYIILIIGIVPSLLQLFYIISNTPVIGANDNLSSVAISLELGKYFAMEENKLKTTEIWIACFGCEEIGLKGSKYFIKKHKNEFEKLQNSKSVDIQAIIIDMPANYGALAVATSEIAGIIKTDKNLQKKLSIAAQNREIKIEKKACFAYTDCASFCREKIASCLIFSVPIRNKFYYHTTKDTLENLYIKNLIDCYNLLQEYLTKIEELR
ncbi:MAG: M28 family metallopeptidase [Promethearchaeota archaeon]